MLKLKRRKKFINKIALMDLAKKRHDEKFKDYIRFKITTFWNLKSEPVIVYLDKMPTQIYFDRNKCDVKFCGKYIYKIPANLKDYYTKIIKISDVKSTASYRNLIIDCMSIIQTSNTLRRKYIYFVL